jgi:putative transposase
MDKFRNKYRIPSARAQWWDYGWDAAYFLTICTKHRKKYFGEVEDDLMILSRLGKIADTCWQEIPKHAKNVELGVYVVMPNHVHGILILNGNSEECAVNTGRDKGDEAGRDKGDGAGRDKGDGAGRDKACLVSTHAPTGDQRTIGRMRFQNPGKNTISSILGGYKSAVSNEIRSAGFEFQWQGRFHDHIIRSEDEYHRISEYIINNPANWKNDKFYEG